MTLHRNSPQRVVLLGGGYVTMFAYKALRRRLGSQLARGEVKLIVVCPKNSHDFHGWTGEVLEGIVAPQNRLTSLREVLDRAKIISGEALSVDTTNQLVSVRVVGTTRIEQVAYDHLVIGTGSRDHLDAVPGLRSHGLPLKGPGEVLMLRNHLIRILEQADSISDPRMRERLLTVVVAGAGFGGVEMCAAITEFFRHSRRHYPVLKKCSPRLVLLHSGADILPTLRPDYDRLADYAAERLVERGVWMRLETRLSCVSEDGATCDDGTFIPSATVLSTLGQARSKLAGTEDFKRTADGRILADPELRVQQQPNVWIAGDIAHVVHPREGNACPPNALWAIKGGEHVGANIARTLLRKPIKPFTFPGLGQAASLGVGQGITELYGMQFTGWFAWTLRLLLFHHFMPSKKKALKVMLDFITLPLLGRGTEALEPAEVVEEHNPRTLSSSNNRKIWELERGSVGQASNKALD